MNHNKKKTLILGAIISGLFFGVFWFFNQSIEKQMTVQMQQIKQELSLDRRVKVVVPADEKREVRQVKASDISSYQIVPQRKSNLFKNQQYWNVLTREAFSESGMESRLKSGEMKGVLRTPKQFKKQVRRIDQRIEECKKKIRKNPDDAYSRRKLQDLYMLKSMVKILKETSVSHN